MIKASKTQIGIIWNSFRTDQVCVVIFDVLNQYFIILIVALALLSFWLLVIFIPTGVTEFAGFSFRVISVPTVIAFKIFITCDNHTLKIIWSCEHFCPFQIV